MSHAPPDAPIASTSRAAPIPTSSTKSVSELLRAARTALPFRSGCDAFDGLFLSGARNAQTGGEAPAPSLPASSSRVRPPPKPGLPAGTCLDLISAPGEGKSRTALSFAIGARITHVAYTDDAKGKGPALPSLDASREVLVLDTESHLLPAVIHSAALVQCEGDADLASQVCVGIHRVDVASPDELACLFLTLSSWLDRHPLVKLVVLDSLTTHLRTALFPNLPPDPNARKAGTCTSSPAFTNGKKRARDSGWGSNAADASDDGQAAMRKHLIDAVRRVLTQITSTRQISVIVTNQVASMHHNALGQRVKPGQADVVGLVPQLGHLWQPPSTYRVFLFGDHDGSRIAGLFETPSDRPRDEHGRRYVQYEVDAGGICDVELAV